MYIEPNTTVKLYHGVPLDLSYRNTVVWDSEGAQSGGFDTYLKHTLGRQSYQRVNQGVFRCSLGADQCYDCNYMAFQNSNYGSKWFYAFITKVEYVNNGMCNITFVIDIIQSYYFQWDFEHCFVERETVASDTVGEHLIGESIQVGEYVMDAYGMAVDLSSSNVLAVEYVSDEQLTGVKIDNIYAAAGIKCFPMSVSGITNANQFLLSMSSKKQSIISVYMIPTDLLGGSNLPSDKGSNVAYGSVAPVNTLNYSKPTTIGSYTPRNKKLLTYPYTYLGLFDGMGHDLKLRYEFFSGNTCSVKVTGTIVSPIKAVATPINYKGSSPVTGSLSGMNANETLSISGFPSCPWATDAYYSYLGTYQISSAINKVPEYEAPANFGGVGRLAAGYLNSVRNLAQGVDNLIHSAVNEVKGNQPHGSADNVTPLFSHGALGIYKATMHITEEVAKSIDDYFDMYGYKVDTLKVPNVRNRPHWTYIKTLGCNIRGSMPADDVEQLQSIVDNGITFWRNISEVGNYSLDNSV